MAKTSIDYQILKFAAKSPSALGRWIECETCKQPFYVTPSRLRQVERKGAVIRYCSLKCRPYAREFNPFWRKHHTAETIAKMMEHPNHPKFVSGPTNPNSSFYGPSFRGSTAEWWKRYLLDTLGKCQQCGYDTEPGILTLHHIDRNPHRNCMENIRLLCPICHALDHFTAKDGQFSQLTNRHRRGQNGVDD